MYENTTHGSHSVDIMTGLNTTKEKFCKNGFLTFISNIQLLGLILIPAIPKLSLFVICTIFSFENFYLFLASLSWVYLWFVQYSALRTFTYPWHLWAEFICDWTLSKLTNVQINDKFRFITKKTPFSLLIHLFFFASGHRIKIIKIIFCFIVS